MKQRAYAFGFATVLVFLPYAVVMSSSGCSDSKMPDVLGDPPIPETGTKPDAGPDVIKFDPDASPCENLPLGGYITQKAMTGTAPTAAGGTIVDGLYFLTNAQLYGMGSMDTFAQTLYIKDGTMHFTKLIKGDTMYENDYASYIVNGTSLLADFGSCVDGGIAAPETGAPRMFSFTATATQFDLQGTVSGGTIVDQFTKQ